MNVKYKDMLIKILLALVIAMGCFLIGYFSRPKEETGPSHSSVTIEATVRELAEFTTLEYNYTNIGKFENHKEFYGWVIPFTTSQFIVTYDGSIKIGMDMKQAAVIQNDKEVTVHLPAARIVSHTIAYDSLEVMDETYSIFTPIVITDYNAFYRDQSIVMENKVIEKGLLSEARESGIKYVEQLLKNILPEDYKITVK